MGEVAGSMIFGTLSPYVSGLSLRLRALFRFWETRLRCWFSINTIQEGFQSISRAQMGVCLFLRVHCPGWFNKNKPTGDPHFATYLLRMGWEPCHRGQFSFDDDTEKSAGPKGQTDCCAGNSQQLTALVQLLFTLVIVCCLFVCLLMALPKTVF